MPRELLWTLEGVVVAACIVSLWVLIRSVKHTNWTPTKTWALVQAILVPVVTAVIASATNAIEATHKPAAAPQVAATIDAIKQPTPLEQAQQLYFRADGQYARAEEERKANQYSAAKVSYDYAEKDYERAAGYANDDAAKRTLYSVSAATALNHVGRYDDAIRILQDSLKDIRQADRSLRGWGLSELAAAIQLKDRGGEDAAKPYEDEAAKNGPNYRTYISDEVKVCQTLNTQTGT